MKNAYLFFLSFLIIAACSTESAIQQVLGVNAEAPVFLGCRPVSSTEIIFSFSVPVRVTSLYLDPALEAKSFTEGEEIMVSFPQPMEAGKKYTADIVVEDSGRNSLNVIVPFRARNDNMPVIILNELRTENSKPRAEFIEFLVLEPGNLGAIRLFIASTSLENPVYEFPPVEVKAGEYIVLHLRATEVGCADETGTDLTLSGGTDSNKEARDFWIFANSILLRNTDVVLLMDQDDQIMDGILLCEYPDRGWGTKKDIADAAVMLSQRGVWNSNPTDAVNTSIATPTRTVCRDQDLPLGGKETWYITVSSGNTPGKKNNPKR